MSWLKRKIVKSNRNQDQPLLDQQDDSKCDQLKGHFHDDLQQLKRIFDRSSDIVFREFQLGGIQKGGLIF